MILSELPPASELAFCESFISGGRKFERWASKDRTMHFINDGGTVLTFGNIVDAILMFGAIRCREGVTHAV